MTSFSCRNCFITIPSTEQTKQTFLSAVCFSQIFQSTQNILIDTIHLLLDGNSNNLQRREFIANFLAIFHFSTIEQTHAELERRHQCKNLGMLMEIFCRSRKIQFFTALSSKRASIYERKLNVVNIAFS